MNDQPTLVRVTDADSAKAFLADLHARGWLYHPEDSAMDCLGHHDLPLILLAQIEAGMKACWEHLADPCEDALALLNAEEEIL